jgi:putative acetyltransferase
MSSVQVVDAQTEEHLVLTRQLFEEYAASLNFELGFQNFAAELENLPGDYAPPRGRLLLAYHQDEVVGCVGLRPFAGDVCEMKRLYVQPAARGRGVGQLLATTVIDAARKIGYRVMRLDTVATMLPAIALYEALGFEPIEPYRYNPLENVRYFELSL